MHSIDAETLVKVKKARIKKPVHDHLDEVFREHLEQLDIDSLKKPWMASKAFVLLDTEEKLRLWVDSVLRDKSAWVSPYPNSEPCPVVAVDTETTGLDTRIIVRWETDTDHVTGQSVMVPVYEVKVEMAGVVLSADGITGVYIPLFHQGCLNVSREVAHYHMQRLFNRSHLVFYNAKFDREILRLTLAIDFRPYPHFEDVQVLNYINDPKANLGDDTFNNDGSGLKGLSKLHLDIEQINLGALTKVSALKPGWVAPPPLEEGQVETKEQKKLREHKKTVQHVPFTWVPTYIAVWYAAADGICTWLLWDKLRHEAQSRHIVHSIDGELIDTLTWIERQRCLIDVKPVERISKWHVRTMRERKERLRQLAIEAGWVERSDDEGNFVGETIFDISKPDHLRTLLYEIKRFKVVKKTKKGTPSADADAVVDLKKLYPNDPFLAELETYKSYVALHPEKLAYEPADNTVRLYLKQSVVAGGRLAASGGKFERDGGFGLNPQAIKSVEEAWWVTGNLLKPDEVLADDVLPYEESDLHPSCFKERDEDVIIGWNQTNVNEETGEEHVVTFKEQYPENILELEESDPAQFRIPIKEKQRVRRKAKGILNNHIGNYLGYAVCLVPKCKSCTTKFGVLAESVKFDATETLNFRELFIAPSGWTYFTSDWSNVEMRVAANVSGEPLYINEFLHGDGDFHTLTAKLVFPEFSNPNTTKERKKELRGIAKVINFALQYGGSAFTIFANIKKDKPDITWKDALNYVSRYWDGVPVYKIFYDEMRRIAREDMTCTTVFGRMVKFQSLMDSQKIHTPLKEEMENYWTYCRVRKQNRTAEENNDVELMASTQATMDRLYKKSETGVRNAQLHNQFMGKIERIAANIPSQGVAGDFMRIALNYIYKWAAIADPLVQSVFRLHSTVHDEIDYSIKNPYVPFIVPRVTRLMRLRKLHARKNWIVPIECDTEYGPSWDVKYHSTGDKSTCPSGWTDIAGLEEYVPTEFEAGIVDKLCRALVSMKETTRQRALDWFSSELHPRSVKMLHHLQGKDGAKLRKVVIALLQLHEYWTIDATPYDTDETMETLEQYEARRGLTAEDRGFMPEMGYLGAVPFDKSKRPALNILPPKPSPSQEDIAWEAYVAEKAAAKVARLARKEAKEIAKALDPEGLLKKSKKSKTSVVSLDLFPEPSTAKIELETPLVEYIGDEVVPTFVHETLASAPKNEANAAPLALEDDLFAPEPKRKVKPVVVSLPYIPPSNPKGLPVLKNLNAEQFSQLRKTMGIGTKQVVFMYEDWEMTLECGIETIPAEFLV
jgi:DNA polymerase I-like protein with 3'-5' exonuclease and polymerase domains/DNA polymerase III epsilon subunit-like protein